VAGFATRTRFSGNTDRSAQTGHALRLKPDHPIGAGQTIRAVIEVNLGPRLEGKGNIVQADIRQFMRETINEVWATWEAYGE
jgi:hypothetical protein